MLCAPLQIKILEESGQLPLAYVAASVHGLAEDADRLGASLPDLPDLPPASGLLMPPTPILQVRTCGVNIRSACSCARHKHVCHKKTTSQTECS
jgi:hypothetical protein